VIIVGCGKLRKASSPETCLEGMRKSRNGHKTVEIRGEIRTGNIPKYKSK
jgi:hypothetical protein